MSKKSGKRGNSEGSIVQRKDGRWCARVSLPNGGRKSYYGKTRLEASKKLQQAQRTLADGLPVAGERQTTGDFLEAWLRDSAAPRVRPKTLKGYADMVRLHIVPVVGRIPLARLNPQNVEAVLASVSAKGLSARTVGRCRDVFRNALNHALKHGLVGRNVAALADAPTAPAREITALMPNAARRVLAAVKGDRLEPLFTVALACGLRQSETLGLRWSDVNVDAGSLSIQRTLQRVNGAFTFFPPKTARSRRTIAMPAPVAAALLQHMKRQLEERTVMGAAWEGDAWGALVFTNEVGGPLTSFHVSRRFSKLLQLAGLPRMRYHDLRHGAASLMAAQGVSARVAMEILGHAQISTTMNIYTHIAPELQKEATEKMADALWPIEKDTALVSKLVSNRLNSG
ncbi:MAG: site-specific integrase [Dehalococcoidia bacterium]|nr:site-specific integrase [Dehalococcoidia bacterium]